MRACAGTPPPGTEVNGRAVRVHDFLGLRLASARDAGGAPTHVPSVALPAARAELGLSSVWSLDQAKITKTARNLALVHLACAWLWLRWSQLGVRAAGDSSGAARPSEASGVAGGGQGP